MEMMWLSLTLTSEATFGRGEGVAGLVDEEVEHDQFGLPFLRGRTLKGLLVEECDNLLYALLQPRNDKTVWCERASRLFGESGGLLEGGAGMYVSDARLPDDLRRLVKADINNKQKTLTRLDVLESLTTIRQQTAMDETGRPEEGSLRSLRVILPGTTFMAKLNFPTLPAKADLALLSACVLALRRAGTGRNRGRGHLAARLLDDKQEDVTVYYFDIFQKEVMA